MSELRTFDDVATLQKAASELIASSLRSALTTRATARMALSGGSTPGPIYERLSSNDRVDWSRVEVTLVDERLAPSGHEDTNETLCRRTLLQNLAADATYQPLREGSVVPDQDLVLLGMGSDGHFASIFASADQLGKALSTEAPDVMRIVPDPLPENAPYERLSMTLPAILRAKSILLVMSGEKKRAVLEEARRSTAERYPIHALLAAEPRQLITYWAP